MRSGESTDQVVAIVGAGMAGGNAAVTLREEGWKGRILLLGVEPDVPYGRPPLSKTYLRGEEDLSDWLVKPAEWYGAHDIELRTGVHVTQIDTAQRQVRLKSGETFRLRSEPTLPAGCLFVSQQDANGFEVVP